MKRLKNIHGGYGIVNVVGPTGIQGVQGLAGATGAQGLTGPTGAQGVMGIQGATGPVGPVGSTGVAGTSGLDQDIVPVSLSTVVLPANSYDYYINETVTNDATFISIRLAYATPGSDQTRVAVYRGNDLNAVLVGQSTAVLATAYTSPYTKIVLTAEPGQNLEFKKGEPICIGIALSGASTSLRGCSCSNTAAVFWFNTTDSCTSGFPANPRIKTNGCVVIPCIRLMTA
jgi:hypothetical protein